MSVFDWLKSINIKELPVLNNYGAMWCGARSNLDYSNRFPWILKQLYDNFNFRIYVEIGIAQCGGLNLIYHNWPDSLIIGIDPLLSSPESDAVNNKVFNNKNVHLIRKKSQDAIKDLLAILDGKKIDLLNIDGDHTEEGSSNDFINYAPLLRNGGLIWLDDIVHEPGVNKTWNKIKNYSMLNNIDYEYFHWGMGESESKSKKHIAEAIDGVFVYVK